MTSPVPGEITIRQAHVSGLHYIDGPVIGLDDSGNVTKNRLDL